MTAIPCLPLGTVLAPTLAVGIAPGRPHRALPASMATTTAADRHLKANTVAFAALPASPGCSPSTDISLRMAPATPTTTVKSP